ncbi:MAG: TetR/AcrR family transcriptional regulator [Anaerolineales bacterium]|nr:TetR/AcrR family transcriptional regulator [Anaerolineales bacterium]
MCANTTRVGKEKILDIAEGLFTEQGYKSVSIRDIAQACGVTNAALYYHFENKEALFAEVLENHVQRLNDHMRASATDVDDIRQQLIAMLTRYASLAGHRRSPMFLLRHKSDGLDKEKARQHHSKLMQLILTPIEDILGNAVDEGQLKPLPEGYSVASLLLGMLHGMAQHRRMCHQESLQSEDVEVVVDVFWNGLSIQR